jgi:hypothetical protein
MDETHFDRLTRAIGAGASRRGLLGCLGGLGFGLSALRFPGVLEAKKKHRKHTKALLTNDYGCVDVGKPCRGNDANCCSGICEGKKPKKGKKDKSRCFGHGAGSCQVGQGICVGGGAASSCGPINVCLQTTGKACYCASINGACAFCQRDPDCVALGWGPNAACVPSEGCPNTGGTYCAAP